MRIHGAGSRPGVRVGLRRVQPWKSLPKIIRSLCPHLPSSPASLHVLAYTDRASTLASPEEVTGNQVKLSFPLQGLVQQLPESSLCK